MLQRMGIARRRPGADPDAMRAAAEAMRRFHDLDLSLEMMLRPHDRAAVHRGLRVPHVRVGRSRARRHRPRRGRRRGGRARVATSAPTRRRTSTTCAPRSPRCATARSSASRARSIAGTEVIGSALGRARSQQSLGANRELRHQADGGRARARARGEPAARRHPRRLPRARTRRRRRRRPVMKFGIFYEHQLPASVDRRLRAPADPGRARAGRARRQARHRLRVGGRAPLPRGVLALQRARGVPRRRVASAPRTSASATASSRRRRATTTRPASPSASRCSTSCRTAGSSSAPASRRREAELGGFSIDPDDQARDVGRGPRGRAALHDRDAVHRALDGEYVHDAAAQRRARSRRRSRTRRCGSRAAAATRSTSPREKGIGALAFAFIDPEEAQPLGRRLLRRRSPSEGVPIGDAVNAQPRVRHDVHVPPRRGRGDRARPRGRELLRLLARALLRVRRAPARRDRRVGRVPASAAPSTGYAPEAARRGARTRSGSAPRSPRGDTTGLRGAVGTPDQIREYLRRYEECGVDQVIFVLPGRQEPPRAHHGVARAVREGSAARVRRARREAGRRRRRSASSRSSRRCSPARSGSSATSTATRSRRCRGSGPTTRARKR